MYSVICGHVQCVTADPRDPIIIQAVHEAAAQVRHSSLLALLVVSTPQRPPSLFPWQRAPGAISPPSSSTAGGNGRFALLCPPWPQILQEDAAAAAAAAAEAQRALKSPRSKAGQAPCHAFSPSAKPVSPFAAGEGEGAQVTGSAKPVSQVLVLPSLCPKCCFCQARVPVCSR